MPAPPAPAPAVQPAPQFAPPADPAAMLDVTAPLAPVAPQPLQPQPVEPAGPGDAYPTSLAMPQVDAEPAVTASHPELIERGAVVQDAVVEVVSSTEGADPTGQWWAPGNALILACAALAWQLVAFYARTQLPAVEAAGVELTNFDRIIGAMPLVDHAMLGPGIGVLLSSGALAIVLVGSRRGLREPALQLGIGAVAALSVAALPLAGMLAG